MKNSSDLDYSEILSLRKDHPTDDPTYREYWGVLCNDNLFISYPRTGAHWINAVIELYYDRPRLPERRATFMDPLRDDWAWFHDHDTIAWDKLYVSNKRPVLYLYRNPVDTIFSWIVYNYNQGLPPSLMDDSKLHDYVLAVSNQYKNHLEKWLLQEDSTPIRYENFKTDPVEEFKKIITHWDIPLEHYDVERIKMAFDIVTPAELSLRKTEPNTLSDYMLTDGYKKEREKFKERYEETINSIVITEDLKRYFE